MADASSSIAPRGSLGLLDTIRTFVFSSVADAYQHRSGWVVLLQALLSIHGQSRLVTLSWEYGLHSSPPRTRVRPWFVDVVLPSFMRAAMLSFTTWMNPTRKSVRGIDSATWTNSNPPGGAAQAVL